MNKAQKFVTERLTYTLVKDELGMSKGLIEPDVVDEAAALIGELVAEVSDLKEHTCNTSATLADALNQELTKARAEVDRLKQHRGAESGWPEQERLRAEIVRLLGLLEARTAEAKIEIEQGKNWEKAQREEIERLKKPSRDHIDL